MKRIRCIHMTVIMLLFTTSMIAQQSHNEVIIIKSVRFTTPLVKKWASEYEKVNPHVRVRVTDEQKSGESVELSVITSAKELKNKHTDQSITYIGRYALLPFTNAGNPLLQELGRKRLDGKGLKELFFENGNIEEKPDLLSRPKYEVTIYSGNNADSFAGAFASHFGYSTGDLKGKRIAGDDIFLVNAIQRDKTGVTFNNLGYIFDIGTRRLKNGLALIPLDVKREQLEVLQETDIDKTITLLENERIPLIPIENIGFVYQEDNVAAKRFVEWVLSQGQQYNQEYGFLKKENTYLSSH